MRKEIKQSVLVLLSKSPHGLTIEDVAIKLNINRATASKYLFALEAEKSIAVREVGKAKLHYLKKYYGGSA